MKWVKRILGGLGVLLALAIVTLAIAMSHDSPCGPAPQVAAGPGTMKAVVHRCYGGPEVARLEDIPKASLRDDRVLVKVHAASVNPLDWHYVRGKPYIMRPMEGFGRPDDIRLGTDFAGQVEAVGRNVTHFKVGDEVFGGVDGAFAEYVDVRENGGIALKPANVTFEQAASVPVAAITALQALRDVGKLKSGRKVLINGASGGVGTFAVQIAKAMGAEVTGVCSTRNVAMVQSIGANHVIDYTKDDFTRGDAHYDLILDMVGNHSLSELRNVLAPEGAAVLIGGTGRGNWLGPMSQSVVAMLQAPFHRNKVGFMLAKLTADDMTKLAQLMQEGKVTPVIDRTYKLADTSEAIRYVEAGHSRGKVIIEVE